MIEVSKTEFCRELFLGIHQKTKYFLVNEIWFDNRRIKKIINCCHVQRRHHIFHKSFIAPLDIVTYDEYILKELYCPRSSLLHRTFVLTFMEIYNPEQLAEQPI